MRKVITLGLLFSLLTLASLSAPTTARTSAQDNIEFQYAAKFVCGKTGADVVAAGYYYTAINVHNPSLNKTVEFGKKFAIALPEEKAGKITEFIKATLRADEAMGIDCPNIYKHTGVAVNTFLEGYVVIHTPMELDVVTIYTAGAPNVATLHTERVPPRRVCTDLKLSINTGFPTLLLANPWTLVVAPTASGPVPRDPYVPLPNTWPPPLTGSHFISGTPTGLTTGFQVDSVWDYETCFCICPDAQNVKLNLTGVRVDDEATFFLNNVQIGVVGTSPFWGQNPAQAEWNAVNANATAQFRPGRNCLRVRVVDKIVGNSGLDLAGTITGAAAACPVGGGGATEGRGEE